MNGISWALLNQVHALREIKVDFTACLFQIQDVDLLDECLGMRVGVLIWVLTFMWVTTFCSLILVTLKWLKRWE